MQQEKVTFKDFMAKFQTEEDCQAHFFNIKWANGFVCPKCGGHEHGVLSARKTFRCKSCGHQTSLTVGTIMHKTRILLRDWFIAIFLFSCDKRGFSAMQLKNTIGCSYPTAWTMLHKLREAMSDRDSEYMLQRFVEMDDAFFGATTAGGKRGRGTDKTPAVIAVGLDADGNPEYVKIEVVESVDGETIKEVATKTVEAGAKISTDGLNVYEQLKDIGYEHHGEVFAPDKNPEHLKWVHTIISNLKAFIAGTYHGLDKKHLQRYFDEFCYRFNRRKFGGQLFNRLLSACTSTMTITYRQLVNFGATS